jgi:hypothetical protein
MSELTVVGKPVTRVDANEKVTGEIVYGYDLVLPNMLYGKTLFSTRAHAKIKKIDLPPPTFPEPSLCCAKPVPHPPPPPSSPLCNRPPSTSARAAATPNSATA